MFVLLRIQKRFILLIFSIEVKHGKSWSTIGFCDFRSFKAESAYHMYDSYNLQYNFITLSEGNVLSILFY